MTKETNHEGRYVALLFLATIMWGFGFIATAKALEAGYTPSFSLLIRFSGAAILFLLLSFQKIMTATKTEIWGGFASGGLLFLAFTAQTYALPLTTPSNNALITSTSMMFVPFILWIFMKIRPAKKVFLGVIVAFVGICVLSVDPTNLASFRLGDAITLICAICFASQQVVTSQFAAKSRPEVLNFFQMLAAAFCAVILFMVEGDSLSQFRPKPELLWVGYLLLFSTLIAYFIQAGALKHLGASRVTIITATESVFAAIFSLIFGYDKLGPSLIIGGGLVLLAIFIVEWKPKTTVRERNLS